MRKMLSSEKGNSALHSIFAIGLVLGVLCALISYMRKHNNKDDWKVPSPVGLTSPASSGWKLPSFSPSSGQANTSGVVLRNTPIEKQGDLYYSDYKNHDKNR